MEAEPDALRREREDRVRQIAEKRRQVEELRRRRAERSSQSAGAPDGQSSAVDRLVAAILSEPPGGSSGASPAKPRGRRAGLQQELRVASVAVDPGDAAVYERSVQTDATGDAAAKGPGGPQPRESGGGLMLKLAEKAKNRAVRPDEAAQIGHQATRAAQPTPDAAAKEERQESEEPKELSAEERKRILGHPEFEAFFQRATLVVERALGQQSFDVTADFRSSSRGDSGEADSQDIMRLVSEHVEDRWARNRPVTDVCFSPHQADLFLASYGSRADASVTDPDGCVLVWNLAMRSRPELSFSCPSQVLTARFHQFDPCLLYGGTYSGAVVLWDTRAKAGPVLRTPLTGKGHSLPVQAMQQVGTQNATSLATASSDGRLCMWSLAMLSLPQETVDLKNESKNRRDLAVTSLSFPENETNALYVGAEDGSVAQVQLHGSKVGVTELYDGHEGPVAGVDMHPRASASHHGVETVDLALSCSFDWSVKLWSVRQYQSPVLSLDAYEDYVLDARWHPTHPAAFAAVDGEGHVDLWNLNESLESPVARCSNPDRAGLGLNRCHWSGDGKRLVTGDSGGVLTVYAVDKHVSQPRQEDFQHFHERMRQLQPIVPRARDAGLYGTPLSQLA